MLEWTEFAPRDARHFVGALLLSWQCGVPDVELVVSELVTNAVVHGQPPLWIMVERMESAIRVGVHDGGHGPLRASDPVQELTALSGRGLGLVAAVASSWGVEPSRSGQVVWANMAARALGDRGEHRASGGPESA
jgi:anti-sigma regulatory factor (Ser/Thr protein kinase)